MQLTRNVAAQAFALTQRHSLSVAGIVVSNLRVLLLNCMLVQPRHRRLQHASAACCNCFQSTGLDSAEERLSPYSVRSVLLKIW